MGTRWKRRREQLLETPVNRLRLDLAGAPLAPCIAALYREIEGAGIRFRPPCYLSNAWGCPDLVPLIGIPFHLARGDLSRLHGEMGYDVEDRRTIMRLLRHEAGHAVCYAYKLYERRDWREIFGPFHKAYSDHYLPDPFSDRHVVYGKHYYAQKHPDEDFAEAFAVWLDPRSSWKKLYAGTPALCKLLFVGDLIREIGARSPAVRGGAKDLPVEEMRFTLREYYGLTPDEWRARADAYAEEVVRRIFPLRAGTRGGITAQKFVRLHAPLLVGAISFWSGVRRSKVEMMLHALERRAALLRLAVARENQGAALVDLASLLTFFVFTYVHTLRLPVR